MSLSTDSTVHPAAGGNVRLLLTAVLILILTASAAGARDVSERQAELEVIKSEITRASENIRRDTRLKGDVEGALEAAERKISIIGRKLHIIRNDYVIQSERLVELQQEMDRRRTLLNREQQKLAEIVRSAFMMNRHGGLRMLLDQEDPALFSRMMTYHEYFKRQRIRQIDVVNRHIDELASASHAVELQTRALARLQAQREKELAEMEQVKAEREQALARINRNLDEQGSQLARLRKDESALTAIIRSLAELLSDIPAGSERDKRFEQRKGALSWPSTGRLVARFGTPRGNSGKKWSGVVINTERGSPVTAIARGRVAFSDWLRGYGLLVIIDHGDDYMSLYGHNESVFKDTGEWVEGGDVIASVGDSGGQPQTGLYFEIRKKGVPQNPVRWCATDKPPSSG